MLSRDYVGQETLNLSLEYWFREETKYLDRDGSYDETTPRCVAGVIKSLPQCNDKLRCEVRLTSIIGVVKLVDGARERVGEWEGAFKSSLSLFSAHDGGLNVYPHTSCWCSRLVDHNLKTFVIRNSQELVFYPRPRVSGWLLGYGMNIALDHSMRLLCLFLFALCCGIRAAVLDGHGRGLDDVFGGLSSPPPPPTEIHKEPPFPVQHATITAHEATSTVTLGGLLSSIEQGRMISSKETSTHLQTTSDPSPLPTSNSVIGTIPPLPSYTPWSSKPPTSTTSTDSIPSPTKSSATQSSSHGAESWKIIGVAVIAFTTVAAILLLSVFFDQWWGFLRDLIWKKKRKTHLEEFMPDWEKASWEIKADALGSNRYPSFAGPRRKERVKDAWDEDVWTVKDNVAGVGSGQKPHEKPTIPTPHPAQPSNMNWSLGFVTPVPPPAALHIDLRTREPPDLRKSRAVSTAYSDIDPYAGIE